MEIYKLVAPVINLLYGFKLSESVSADVKKFVRERDAFALEIGDDPEGSDWSMEYGTVEFAEDICSSGIVRYNDKQTSVAQFHFRVK